VVIVDDHPLIREAVRALLAPRETVQLVGAGSCGDDALLLVEQCRPDVLLLDISMPQSDNEPGGGQFAILAALERLHDEFPQTKVVILSQYLEPSLSHALARCKINGYLLKSDNLTLRLAEAIEVVHSGGVYSSQEASQIMGKSAQIKRESLTEMQVKILAGLVQDPTISYRALARELDISINTFKWHIKNAFQILGVRNRSAAIVVCIQNNLVPGSQDQYTPFEVAFSL
jgi:DNA-binding NarL/FixJ family response regulator